MALVCSLNPHQKFMTIHEAYNRLPDGLGDKTEAIRYLETIGFLTESQPPYYPGYFIEQP